MRPIREDSGINKIWKGKVVFIGFRKTNDTEI